MAGAAWKRKKISPIRRRVKDSGKTKVRLMYCHPAKIEDSGKDKEAVVILPLRRRNKDSSKTEKRLMFRHAANIEDQGKDKAVIVIFGF